MKKKNNILHIMVIGILALTISAAGLHVDAHGNSKAVKKSRNMSLDTPVRVLSVEDNTALEFKAEIIRLVNLEREKVGAKALKTLEVLKKPASLRAAEISNKFSHTRPNGKNWATVFENFGLNYTKAGENLANGFKTPEAAVKAWMESPGHRANILNPEFTNISIGYFKDGQNRIHLAQLFYTPRQGLAH